METRGPVAGFPKESEFPVTMQAITDNDFQLSFFGETYKFNKNDVFNEEKRNIITQLAREILRRSKEKGLTDISFCIIYMFGRGYKINTWIFLFDKEFKENSILNEDAVITFYNVDFGFKKIKKSSINCDSIIYKDKIIEKPSHVDKSEADSRLYHYKDLIDQINDLMLLHGNVKVNTEDKQSFESYILSMFDRKAKEDIENGRFKGSIYNWRAEFKFDHLGSVASSGEISNMMTNKSDHLKNVEKRRKMLLVTAYYLNMTYDETRRLFELGDMEFNPYDGEEAAIILLLREGLYEDKKNKKKVDQILADNDCFDIQNLAGFLREEQKEEKKKKTKNKKNSKRQKER